MFNFLKKLYSNLAFLYTISVVYVLIITYLLYSITIQIITYINIYGGEQYIGVKGFIFNFIGDSIMKVVTIVLLIVLSLGLVFSLLRIKSIYKKIKKVRNKFEKNKADLDL